MESDAAEHCPPFFGVRDQFAVFIGPRAGDDFDMEIRRCLAVCLSAFNRLQFAKQR